MRETWNESCQIVPHNEQSPPPVFPPGTTRATGLRAGDIRQRARTYPRSSAIAEDADEDPRQVPFSMPSWRLYTRFSRARRRQADR